jgi:hypothetical protein
MKFTKNKGLFFAAVFIIAAVYNVIVFVVPFVRGAGFWTAYVFSMFAMLLTAAVCLHALFSREGLKSYVYGTPLILVAWQYLIIQLIAGLLEMVFIVPFKIGIVVNTVILGVCVIRLIIVGVGKAEIERIDEKIKGKVFYIKSLQASVEGMVDRMSDDSIKKILKSLAETIRYSDPVSGPQLAAIENGIEAKAAVLEEAVEKNDEDAVKALCNELQQLFAERNQKCKILKQV